MNPVESDYAIEFSGRTICRLSAEGFGGGYRMLPCRWDNIGSTMSWQFALTVHEPLGFTSCFSKAAC